MRTYRRLLFLQAYESELWWKHPVEFLEGKGNSSLVPQCEVLAKGWSEPRCSSVAHSHGGGSCGEGFRAKSELCASSMLTVAH